MVPFNKDRKFGGKPSFNRPDRGPSKFGGGPKRFGGSSGGGFNRPGGARDFERPEMFKATCASCGKSCEVPFKPTGQRPVYCRDCFQQHNEEQPKQWHDRIRTADYSRPSQPRTFDRPERSERFERPEQPRPPATGQLQQQIEQINIKLDRILKALAAPEQVKPVEHAKPAEHPKAVEQPKVVAEPEITEEPKAPKPKAEKLKAADKPKAARKASKKAAASKKEAAETPDENDEE